MTDCPNIIIRKIMSISRHKKAQQQNRIHEKHLSPSPLRAGVKKAEPPTNIDLNSSFNTNFMQQPKEPISYFKNKHYRVKLDNQSSRSPQKLKQNKFASPTRLSKIHNLIKDISSHHQQMRNRVQQLKGKQNEQSIQLQQCTFNPNIRRNPRYYIQSTLEDRNKSWDEARMKHYTSIKQQLVQQQVKECTFNPKMIALPQSKRILKNKQLRINMAKELQHDKRQQNPLVQAKFTKITNEILPKEKKSDGLDIQKIRKILKEQMYKIQLQF